MLIASNLVVNSKLLRFLGVLKLTRIMRLSKIISYSHMKSDSKSFMNFIKLFFFLAIYIHLQAWIWFIIVKINEVWIPPLDTLGNTTDLYDRNPTYQYLMSIYHSVLIFCPNDLLPQVLIELLFTTFALIISSLINAVILSNMTLYAATFNRRSTELQAIMDRASTTMKNINLPEGIRNNIRSYISTSNATFSSQKELESFWVSFHQALS